MALITTKARCLFARSHLGKRSKCLDTLDHQRSRPTFSHRYLGVRDFIIQKIADLVSSTCELLPRYSPGLNPPFRCFDDIDPPVRTHCRHDNVQGYSHSSGLLPSGSPPGMLPLTTIPHMRISGGNICPPVTLLKLGSCIASSSIISSAVQCRLLAYCPLVSGQRSEGVVYTEWCTRRQWTDKCAANTRCTYDNWVSSTTES